MQYRTLGRTGFQISEVSLGTWQVGGKWGSEFSYENADEILNKAVDLGVNFIDTADVYSEGHSETAVGRLLRSRSERIYVATKCGRQINPHVSSGYTEEVLRSYVEDSLRRLQVERLDLMQLHCPPPEVYDRPEIFEAFDQMVEEGKIANLGVSVQTVDEALKAIEYPNVHTIQIIFNVFRQKPAEVFFKEAAEKNVGILARVPLASGLLSGKYTKDTQFSSDDHRSFNRDGSAFDKGETFSGIDYEEGLKIVDMLKTAFPGTPLHLLALKWILMFDEVSCVIPGASNMGQAISNAEASNLKDLNKDEMEVIKSLYNEYIRKTVHHLW